MISTKDDEFPLSGEISRLDDCYLFEHFVRKDENDAMNTIASMED